MFFLSVLLFTTLASCGSINNEGLVSPNLRAAPIFKEFIHRKKFNIPEEKQKQEIKSILGLDSLNKFTRTQSIDSTDSERSSEKSETEVTTPLKIDPNLITEKTPWSVIKNFVNQGDLHHFTRDQDIQRTYDLFKKDTSRDYGRGFEDLLLIRIFKFNAITSTADGKKYAIDQGDSLRGPILVQNDFPYSLPSNVKHYVVWAQFTLTEEDVLPILQDNFKAMEFVYFLNPVVLQSVKSISHFQVFVKIY